MLAVLLENFKLANLLVENNLSDRYYKNSENETVYDIAMRLNLVNVQKFLVQQQKNVTPDAKRGEQDDPLSSLQEGVGYNKVLRESGSKSKLGSGL